jgi:hypothetical protein
MTPQALAEELGVLLSTRSQPNLQDTVPKRFVTLEEAKARGLSWCYDLSLGECRYGHQAARRTSNVQICSDCERAKDSKEPIYGKARANKHYPAPRRAAKDPSAPVVIAAPAAPPAQLEPTKKEQEFLAALDETRDFDAAAQRTNFSRSQIETRASVNDVFRKALTDLCERRGIAWTRAPDAETFDWSPAAERQFARTYVDCGMIAQARNDLGISASEFHAHLANSPTFASLVEEAHPLAAITLRDRATQAAAVGKIDLLKYLETNAPKDDLSNLSHEQINAEITRLLQRFDKQGLLGSHEYRHVKTGARIDLREYEPVDVSNADLVS